MHISLGVLITGIFLGLMEASTAAAVETAAQSGFDFLFLFQILVADPQRTVL